MSGNRDDGFTTIQYVVACALSLVLFVMLGNLLVDLYERGAVRDALDEGVRAGVPFGAGPAACVARAQEVVEQIAGGHIARVDPVQCRRVGDEVVAETRLVMPSWLPMLVPSWTVRLRAVAHQE